MIAAYLGTADGTVATPKRGLVTGYDFLEDAALSVRDEFTAGMGAAGVVDSLIADQALSPLDPANWTADDLAALLLKNRYDLAFLAGHFSANSALAADYATSVLASDLDSAPVDLTNAIYFSAGCHSGYNIVNEHAVPNVTVERDWAQVFARKGATLIAGTGYQYGDTEFLEYSERLYLEFAPAASLWKRRRFGRQSARGRQTAVPGDYPGAARHPRKGAAGGYLVRSADVGREPARQPH